MDIQLDASIIQNLVILIAVLVVFAVVGLKRGWIGQLVILALIISIWGVFKIAGDLLVKLANNLYKGVFFLVLCGTEEDPFACLETSGIMQKILIDPQDPEQVRLLFLIIFVFTLLLAYLLLARFGKAPSSIVQKLTGALMGVANGLVLSYLLLPFTPEQLPLVPLPAAEVEEGLPEIVELMPRLTTACQVSVPFVVLILFVLFVIVAVRFIRPKKAES